MSSLFFNKLLRGVTTLSVKRIRNRFVHLETKDNGIAVVTMENKEKRNCINVQLLEELDAVFSSLTEHWNLRSVILKSGISEAFSVGCDLEEYTSLSDEEVMYVALKTRKAFLKISKFPIPTVACIDGPAVGSGAELALSCDFRVGSDNSVFSFPDVRLGLIPVGGACARLQRIVGVTKAKELIFTGRSVGCAEALQIGLIDFHEPYDTGQRATRFAEEMLSSAPLALRAAKKAVEDVEIPDIDVDMLRTIVGRDDRKEGVRALLKRRQPRYKGQ